MIIKYLLIILILDDGSNKNVTKCILYVNICIVCRVELICIHCVKLFWHTWSGLDCTPSRRLDYATCLSNDE